MDEMNDKLNAILSNPQMMQQIMNLAQSVNAPSQEKPQDQQPQQSPGGNVNMLNRLTTLAQKSSIDREQQSLLKALGPYLSHEKLGKLERAMQAAKMAGAASSFLNAGGLSFLTGR